MNGSCIPDSAVECASLVTAPMIEAVEQPVEPESNRARAVVRGGEVQRIRRQAEPPPASRLQLDPRTAAITCFLLCAVLAGAIGIASWIELSPKVWSGLAVALSAAAGLLALFPKLELRDFARKAAQLFLLSLVLAAGMVVGAWVSVSETNPVLAGAALCAPPLLTALLWRQQWPVIAAAVALVAVGAAPAAIDAGALPPSHLGALLAMTAMALGAAYGHRSAPPQAARPGPTPATEGSGSSRRILELARSFASHEQGEIAQVIVNDTARALGACGTILLLWDETSESYRVGALTGGGPVDLDEIRQLELTPDWISRLRRDGNKLVTPLPFTAIREPVLLSLIRRWQARSLYAVPFHRGSSLLGILLVARSKARSAFTEADDDVLSGMAPHASAALAHGRLISDLQAANALKEEFMATMSHELRTPLNVIIGYTDMQLEGAFGDLDEEHTSTLQTVREQAVQLLELIQATLDMSRLERGLVSLDPTEVNVRQMLEDLQKRIPPAWRKPTVELEWKIDDDLPLLVTDSSKLQILLRNLIHNAMKFTNNGLVLVAASRHASRPYVTFLVQDSGIGIKAEHLSQIFDMFRQAPDGESHSGGVGLGLYIVKRLAAALGAEIEVSSAPGRGASFRIHLPLPEPTTSEETDERDDPAA
jgi:signal transduction histidine kinase